MPPDAHRNSTPARRDALPSGAGMIGPAAIDATDEMLSPGGDERTWMAHAACRHMSPAVFFPADGEGVRAAKQICAACPVSGPCLAYALTYRIDQGVWGGASERQRRRLARAARPAR